MGDLLQVRISAGKDPATGERLVLVESVTIEKPGNERSERAAQREAEKVLTRLQAEADSLKVARTKSTFGALLDRWLRQQVHGMNFPEADHYCGDIAKADIAGFPRADLF